MCLNVGDWNKRICKIYSNQNPEEGKACCLAAQLGLGLKALSLTAYHGDSSSEHTNITISIEYSVL
jgi:hypothetical protein